MKIKNSTPGIQEEGIWDLEELENEERAIKPNQWGAISARTFKAFSVTHTALPPGCYTITVDNRDESSIFSRKDIKIDEILAFKGGLADKLLAEIDGFWRRGAAFRAHGFLHRRGYLLYGSQGTGKSSIVWQVAQDVIKRGGVVFVCDNPRFFTKGLAVFRQVEMNRPVVCIFEDIDAIIEKYGEPEILQLLDGDNQIDRVINVATTNYPEKLDKRIVNRPRRFDRIHKVEVPDDVMRSQFFAKKAPEKKAEWARKTKGLSFAALTEALISVYCLGNDMNDTIETLRDIESANPTSSDFGKKVGFGDEDGPGGDGSSPTVKDVEKLLKKHGETPVKHS